MPNNIEKYLEKGKIIDDDWKDKDKLNLNINKCIYIENNVKDIISKNDTLKKYISMNILEVKFNPEEEINDFLEKIFKFGRIIYNNDFRFK